MSSSPSPPPPAKPPVVLRKHRQKGHSAKARWDWATVWRPLLALLLAAVGVIFLLNPFWPFIPRYTDPTQVANPQLGDRLPHWLAYEGGAAVLGLIFIALAVLWAAYLGRERINNNSQLWADACPHCHQATLKRIHRRPLDRLWNLLGFPVRRYLCEHCGWKGSRLDRTRLQR